LITKNEQSKHESQLKPTTCFFGASRDNTLKIQNLFIWYPNNA